MICKNCGKEIPEGMNYCPECGESADAPVIVTSTKIKKEPKKVTFNLSGYINALKTDMSVLLALIGAVVVYLSTFMSWIWEKLSGVKASGNLFDIGSKVGDKALHQTGIFVMAIVVLIMGLSMIALSGAEFVGPLEKFSGNKLVKLIPVVVCIALFIIILKNDAYNVALNHIEEYKQTVENMGMGSAYKGGRGIGPVLYIIGNALYTLSVFIGNKE